MKTFEEVIFDNGQVIKRLGIFHNTKNGDIEQLLGSLHTYYNQAIVELKDYGEGYIVIKDLTNNKLIQLECIN